MITTEDKVIAPEVQKLFAARMHARTEEVAASTPLSHAKEIAAFIEEAAVAEW